MSDLSHPSSEPPLDTRRLARAIRCVLVIIVLGISILSVKSSLSIRSFEAIYQDMLGGQPLPSITALILRAEPVLTSIAILIPIIAIGTLFSRHVITSLYVLAVLGFISVVESVILYQALSAPLFNIIKALGSGAP